MNTLSIDVESRSGTDLAKCGVYRYAEDNDFELLLFAYSIDNRPVEVVSLATGETIPEPVLAALTDPTVIKWAFNAAFERVTIGAWLHNHGHLDSPYLDPHGWRCTMVHATALGLPRSLKHAATALRLDDQKMDEGTDLIKHFCIPHKPKPTDGLELFDAANMTHWNSPEQNPEKWADFIEYNRQDVAVENAIRTKIESLPLPEHVWDEYAVDQAINDTGVAVDVELADQAVAADRAYREHCLDEARELTGLDNPASPTQLRQWLESNGVPIASMTKDAVADALETATGAPARVLQLRQDMSRSSVKKYEAMGKATCADGRARGLLQFYGAGRTGRWAGRLIQVQNLPRNYLPDLDQARELVREGHHDALEMLYDSIPDTLSQLIRTALIPADGHRFVVADYSAIEARVLAWMAGQQSTLDAFERGEDIYCATASEMFGVPVEKGGTNADLRQKGKIAVLACGYQGGVGAMRAMGALRMGLAETELQPIVDAWRTANPHVVDYWYAVDRAAQTTIKTGQEQTVRNLTLRRRAGALTITLPSGRDLVYPGAHLGRNRFDKPSIVFKGIGMNRRVQAEETYGGKLVENIVQAVARDLMAYAIHTVHDAGHRIVMTVHDELVVEAPPETTVTEICDLMAKAPEWAPGLPIEADGYACHTYRKED